MLTHYLEKFFNPTAVAVIGASEREDSVGWKVFKNLLRSHFRGEIFAVNPKHKSVQGKVCFPSVKAINKSIDLCVITTPAATIPQILSDCGEKGIKAAIVISAGFGETGPKGKEIEKRVLALCHQYQIKIMGPNCLGFMRPAIHLNATFDNNFAYAGSLALVSQSGAICAAILDWAVDQQIGFSTVASIGNCLDLDFSDILDYLTLDPETQSILLYVEGIQHSRRFISSLRAAARLKPVIVIKGARNQQGARAALSHTGALIGNDEVFEAALRRAGVLRVASIEEFFSAAEVLSSNYRVPGNRLSIITNGGGAGVMAADRASELNISLPVLSDKIIAKYNKKLPPNWSHQNPIDILGDATPERYHSAIDICRQDEDSDGILTILVPVAMSQPLKVAEQIIQEAKKNNKPILTCWMGERQAKTSRKLFSKHQVPNFDTPEKAVEAFSYLANYQHNQNLLVQIPSPYPIKEKTDIKTARTIIEGALKENRKLLTMMESKNLLKAFGIPVNKVIAAANAEEAVQAAEYLGFPVVMKINSPDITHKQDVGGVQLNILTADAVRLSFQTMINSVKKAQPQAQILGVTIERLFKTKNDRELMVGVLTDKVFGPVISFGMGGNLVEVIKDNSIELPPLNPYLATQLIERTRIAKTLSPFRGMLAASFDALIEVLLQVSTMICELPYIKEMDINPLIINDKETMAIDARIVIDSVTELSVPYSHLAIHPYPAHLAQTYTLSDGTPITIRPIKPEDAEMQQNFFKDLSSHSKYLRFFSTLGTLTPNTLIRITQIDYDREMALIAVHTKNNKDENIGLANYFLNPDSTSCEFGIIVADAWQSKGLGYQLLSSLMHLAKNKGLKQMMGYVLTKNKLMLEMAQQHGFKIASTEDPNIKMIVKRLNLL